MVVRVKPLSVEDARNVAETHALVARAPDLTVLRITGKDRLSWLSGLLTQDVGKLRPGAAAYSFLCEKKGKILCDMHLFVHETSLDLVLPREALASVSATLEHHLIMEDVEVHGDERPVFRVYGPKAETVAKALSGAVWQGAPFRLPVAHVVASEDADTFAEKLADALRETEGGVAPDGFEEGLRVALGIPRFGMDFGPAHYPQETSLHGLGVSFSKGCYLGQEVLYMLEHRGHAKRKLVRLECDGAVPVGSALLDGDAEVGNVTSVVCHEAGFAAIAMVKAAATGKGKTLRSGPISCKVHEIELPPA
jgi:tRNA-modifying protein YgfZ